MYVCVRACSLPWDGVGRRQTDDETGISQAAPAAKVLAFAGLPNVPVYHAPEELHGLALGVAITFALLAAIVTHNPRLFLFPTKSGFWMTVSLVGTQGVGGKG